MHARTTSWEAPARLFGWWCFAAILVVVNAAVLAQGVVGTFTFLPGAFRDGEWWRLFTHPWIHVSWYHFALDGLAFLWLYASLPVTGGWKRPALVFGAAVGSLIVSLVGDAAVAAKGLCGLSGIAHGLMAVVSLEFVREGVLNRERGMIGSGVACFVAVTGKSMLEAASGSVAFASLHAGDIGSPVSICHAGGALGALAVLALLGFSDRCAAAGVATDAGEQSGVPAEAREAAARLRI